MGTNNLNKEGMPTASDVEDSNTTVEIKIKTMDSRTYTLRVNKCLPVHVLKAQIATITGVVSEQQRLICRGRVLRDDQLLSAYHVEDGHTLHLVSRQPMPSTTHPGNAEGSEGSHHQAVNSASSSGQNSRNPVSHSVVIEAVDMGQGDRSTSALSRFLSMFNSLTPASTLNGNSGTDPRETASERLNRAPGVFVLRPSSPALGAEFVSQQASFQFPTEVNLESHHPEVIPDALTTIHQFLGHMRNEFTREAFRDTGELTNDGDSSGIHFNQDRNHGFQSGPISGPAGLPSTESLAEIMDAANVLLREQAGGRLSQLARQLQNQANVRDPVVRRNIQSSAMRSGLLMQDVGSLLLELGRTIRTLRMGQTPVEALVNAGPAVYISESGPNIIMVQPAPTYPGSSYGGTHTGTANYSFGLEGHAIPVSSMNLGEQGGSQQTQEQTGSERNSSGANFIPRMISGLSGSVPFSVEYGVRMIPVRTVLAQASHSIPTGATHPTTETSVRPTRSTDSLRNQQQNFGNQNDVRGTQYPTEPRDGRHEFDPFFDLMPMSPISPRNQADPLQGFESSQSVPVDNNNSDPSRAHAEQDARPTVTEMLTRFHEWLSSIPAEGEINGSHAFHQNSGIDSSINQTGTINGAPNEPAVSEDGLFFSGLVRQLMPYISRGRDSTGISSSAGPDSSVLLAQSEDLNDTRSSQDRREPPEAPSSKRPKRD